MLISNKWISHSGSKYNMASMALIKKGELIKFKVHQSVNAKESTLTIFKMIIHPKSRKNGGDYLSAQKNWRKKCVNLDDKILRQKGINHKNVMNL